jgi:hypothetical protein
MKRVAVVLALPAETVPIACQVPDGVAPLPVEAPPDTLRTGGSPDSLAESVLLWKPEYRNPDPAYVEPAVIEALLAEARYAYVPTAPRVVTTLTVTAPVLALTLIPVPAVNDETPPPPPFAAEVMRPCASTVMFAEV